MTCPPHNAGCFSASEKAMLEERGWNEQQIEYAENSIIEDKVKQLLMPEIIA